MISYNDLEQGAHDRQTAALDRAARRRLIRSAKNPHPIRSYLGERAVMAAASMITDPTMLERVADDLAEKAHCCSAQAA